MMAKTRVTFGTAIGGMLAAAGSAVGLGNIWRFPYMLGSNGGAAFLLIYIGCVLGLGLPVMITEFFIGRHTRSNPAGAYQKLAPRTAWKWLGYCCVLVPFLILGYYYVVSGWTLEYMFQAVTGSFHNKSAADLQIAFNNFSSGTFRPIFWTFIFIAVTYVIVASGVKKGIEKASKIMMPLLFIILVALCVRSVTLPGAAQGLSFLFHPDFSKITSSVVLSAMGQAFFSLSLGMGCLIIYSSYFSKEDNLYKMAFQVTLLDTIAAILASVMIFPAVFSFGIQPTAGPPLVFITLPNVFGQVPLEAFWSFIFFLLVALAALTSTISLHEVVTAFLHEEIQKLSRAKAALIVALGTGTLGIISSLSFGEFKDFTFFGMSFFDTLDFLTAKIMLPLNGMLSCIFVGHYVSRTTLHHELTNDGKLKFHWFGTYAFFMKFVAPIAILLIFLNELGFFRWIERLL